MRILHVFYGKDFAGGASYSMASLVRGLASAGHEVHALIPSTRKREMVKHLDSDIECHEFYVPWVVYDGRNRSWSTKIKNLVKGLSHILLYVPSEIYTYWLAKKIKADVIHIGGAVISTGRWASKWSGAKLVWHVREFVLEDHGLEYFPWFNRKSAFADADALICVSDALMRKMHSIDAKQKIFRVYNGMAVPIERPPSDSPARSGTRLLFAGGLSATKGLPEVLDAVAQLDRSIPWTLDIFGRSNGEQLRDFRSRCIHLGVTTRVLYQGLVKDLLHRFPDYDAVIVASRMEAFGRVTAEAMLSRCLVIGAASGATQELLGQARGVLYSPGDAASLAAAINDVASNIIPRSSVLDAAQDFATRQFSEEAYIASVLSVYRHVCEPA